MSRLAKLALRADVQTKEQLSRMCKLIAVLSFDPIFPTKDCDYATDSRKYLESTDELLDAPQPFPFARQSRGRSVPQLEARECESREGSLLLPENERKTTLPCTNDNDLCVLRVSQFECGL